MAHRDHRQQAPADIPDKTCASCGRRIEWRRQWAADWDEIRYCSDACRRRGVSQADKQLEVTILEKLTSARSVDISQVDAAAHAPEPARRAARRLVARGEVEITQRGRVVDPSTAK